jgi:beta-RFAP synthase
MSDAVSDRLCRLLLMGLMPAVVERDLAAFGASLTAIQMHVGRAFASAQGGRELAREDLAPIVDQMRQDGLAGVGQSSWGPALYGFAPRDPEFQAYILERLADRFALPPDAAFWTEASRHGARMMETGPDRP